MSGQQMTDLAIAPDNFLSDMLATFAFSPWKQVEAYLATPCVYAVRLNSLGHLKVGLSSFGNARRRIAQLQTGASEPLLLVAVLAGGANTERHLHRRFAARRLHGEWFSDLDSHLSDIMEGLERPVDRHALDLADKHALAGRRRATLQRLKDEVRCLEHEVDNLCSEIDALNDAHAVEAAV
jgi:hypothetical protein